MSKDIVRVILEMFELTRTPRLGWRRAGQEFGKSANVAEEACLSAQIAYVLAVMEGYEYPERAACETLFIYNKQLWNNQVRVDTEITSVDFIEKLPSDMQVKFRGYLNEFKLQKSTCAVIVKDAGILQHAFQAVFSDVFVWASIFAARDCVCTKSAKEIIASLRELLRE